MAAPEGGISVPARSAARDQFEIGPWDFPGLWQEAQCLVKRTSPLGFESLAQVEGDELLPELSLDTELEEDPGRSFKQALHLSKRETGFLESSVLRALFLESFFESLWSSSAVDVIGAKKRIEIRKK